MDYIKRLPCPLGASSGQCGQEIFLPACSLQCHQMLTEFLLQRFLEDSPLHIGCVSQALSNPSFLFSFSPRAENPPLLVMEY